MNKRKTTISNVFAVAVIGLMATLGLACEEPSADNQHATAVDPKCEGSVVYQGCVVAAGAGFKLTCEAITSTTAWGLAFKVACDVAVEHLTEEACCKTYLGVKTPDPTTCYYAAKAGKQSWAACTDCCDKAMQGQPDIWNQYCKIGGWTGGGGNCNWLD